MELYITDTALKVSESLYFFTTFISHGVENYFPRLWGTGISDAIFLSYEWMCISAYLGVQFGVYCHMQCCQLCLHLP